MDHPSDAHPAPMGLATPPAWILAGLAVLGLLHGARELRSGRPRLVALCLVAAGVAALTAEPLACALALTVGIAAPRLRRSGNSSPGLAGAALGAAVLTWILAGPDAAAQAVTLTCAAACLEAVAATETGTTQRLIRRGITWGGRDALSVAAAIDGIAIAPGVTAGGEDVRLIASARDRQPALAAAADLLTAVGEPLAAAVGAAAAHRGLAPRPVTWLRRLGPDAVIGSSHGRVVRIGPPQRLAEIGVTVPRRWLRAARRRPAVGVAWGGRCRGLLVLADHEAAGLRRLHAMRCEVWTGDGRVIPLRHRRYEPAFAVASMIARGRRVAAVAPAGEPVPVADLALIAGRGQGEPAIESPWVSLPQGDLDQVATLLATCRRLRGLRVAGRALAISVCGAGLLLAASGAVPRPLLDGTLAVALVLLATAQAIAFFTSSQRRYA